MNLVNDKPKLLKKGLKIKSNWDNVLLINPPPRGASPLALIKLILAIFKPLNTAVICFVLLLSYFIRSAILYLLV